MIVIFAGPTIREQQIRALVEDALVMPPVSAGDVHHATQSLPEAIGIIDGYFHSKPSVWHKEILHALDIGIPVLGASSMGALRAAELHTFGMIGIGRIFEDFRDGILEDDDEVALQHGPEELDFTPLSEPMVNIRATVRRALKEGIINQAVASDLIGLAKKRFYSERNWDGLTIDASEHGVDSKAIRKLNNWLPEGRIDQKYDDAIAMLMEIKNFQRDEYRSQSSEFKFQHTVMWDRLAKHVDRNREPSKISLMIDCLRTEPERYQDYRNLATRRMLKNMDTEVVGAEVSRRELSEAVTQFRKQKKLYTASALQDWLSANGTDHPGLEKLVAKEISSTNLIRTHPFEFKMAMLSELKSTGCDAELSSKADAIIKAVKKKKLRTVEPGAIGRTNLELQMWYFETCLRMPMPDNVDQYLARFDLSDRREFERMMTCQFIYWQDKEDTGV